MYYYWVHTNGQTGQEITIQFEVALLNEINGSIGISVAMADPSGDASYFVEEMVFETIISQVQ